MKKKTVTSTRTAYMENCPFCQREIIGFSESGLEYNLKLHKEGCDKKK